MSSDNILETRGLVKEFKGFVAVNDVNLQVRRGTIHALIGPNGAGKTTCLLPGAAGRLGAHRAGHHLHHLRAAVPPRHRGRDRRGDQEVAVMALTLQ